jgi:hypothetical protein
MRTANYARIQEWSRRIGKPICVSFAPYKATAPATFEGLVDEVTSDSVICRDANGAIFSFDMRNAEVSNWRGTILVRLS